MPEILNVNEEESTEIEVPVIQVQEAFEEAVEKEEVKETMPLDQVRSGDSMFEDEMRPANPYEIHGDTPVNVDPICSDRQHHCRFFMLYIRWASDDFSEWDLRNHFRRHCHDTLGIYKRQNAG